MKLQGYLKGTGKLGNIVVSRVAGETIARDYNPNVSNPSTVAQVNQRARMKLASQLAAALAPVIVIPKDGLKSARNLFIKKNMDQIVGNNGQARIIYENIQLTNGNAGLPAIRATRSSEDGIEVQLAETADAAVSRVVYIVYKKTTEDQLQFVGSAIQETAGDDGLFKASFGYVAGDLIIWAYGMKDVTATAKAKYGDYFISSGEDIAQLVMSRKIGAGDYQFTQTRGNTIFGEDAGTIDAGDNEFMVYVGTSGPGSAAIQGATAPRKAFQRGASCTVVATPNEGCQFVAWRKAGSSANLSTSAEYTFTVEATNDLVAFFNNPSSSEGDGDEGSGMDE